MFSCPALATPLARLTHSTFSLNISPGGSREVPKRKFTKKGLSADYLADGKSRTRFQRGVPTLICSFPALPPALLPSSLAFPAPSLAFYDHPTGPLVIGGVDRLLVRLRRPKNPAPPVVLRFQGAQHTAGRGVRGEYTPAAPLAIGGVDRPLVGLRGRAVK
ncbi:hypothetical protein C8F04DRAFT_1192248 [Mycena alexandri]|uniref:Uncharacterized protein n=1 Tax=Mycena alexandri TaxID=1745969 RepID=A0AAD6SB24_9AGAR|nr:hypothetical protein C8F04DRAFT_1192248 [Mycena alexandri]